MKIKIFVIYIILTISIIVLSNYYKNLVINNSLKRSTEKYYHAYKNVLNQYYQLADFIDFSIVFDPKILGIYKKLQNADQNQKIILHDELAEYFANYGELQSRFNVHSIHFFFKDESFLRISNSNDYCNMIDFESNGTDEKNFHKTQGFIFPILNNGKKLGSLRISFNMEIFTSTLMDDYDVWVHYLIKRHIDEKYIKDDDFPYIKTHVKDIWAFKSIEKRVRVVSGLRKEDRTLPSEIESIVVNSMTNVSIYDDNINMIRTVIPILDKNNVKTDSLLITSNARLIKNAIVQNYIRIILIDLIVFGLLIILYQYLKAVKKVKQKAYIDGLTQVYNRNKFDEIFEYESKNMKRYKNSNCLAIIDIDLFKKFNDTYGHLVGDEVLTMLAQKINKIIRVTDTFARWGGEEFVLFLKNSSLEDATKACDKIRETISHLEHPTAGNITISIGLTKCEDYEDSEDTFKRADKALYKAKEEGRNKVVAI